MTKHSDTSISLHPMSFEEAIARLAIPPKRADSEAEMSDSTIADAPESETSEPQSADS